MTLDPFYHMPEPFYHKTAAGTITGESVVSQDVSALARQGGAERRFERGGRDWVHFANKRRRGFYRCALATATVLVDELDAGIFQGPLHFHDSFF
jgi:hypothetical protein